MSYLRCYSRRPKNSGRQIRSKIQEIWELARKIENNREIQLKIRNLSKNRKFCWKIRNSIKKSKILLTNSKFIQKSEILSKNRKSIEKYSWLELERNQWRIYCKNISNLIKWAICDAILGGRKILNAKFDRKFKKSDN